jgi:hypothetical protein
MDMGFKAKNIYPKNQFPQIELSTSMFIWEPARLAETFSSLAEEAGNKMALTFICIVVVWGELGGEGDASTPIFS